MTDKAHKAERARALLNDDLLREVFDSIRERQIQAFTDSAPQATETREEAHRRLWALNQIIGELEGFIADHTIHSKERSAP